MKKFSLRILSAALCLLLLLSSAPAARAYEVGDP